MTAAPAVASRRFPALETAALAVFALALAWQTIVPPPVGLADNGDFARIAGPMGLRATASPEPPHRYFGFLLPGFQITSPWWRSRYGTSELVPIGLARTIGKVFSKTGFVDIRVIGAANALFVLVGAAVLLAGTRRWRPRSRILFAFLVVGIYSDAAYATPLNSLFSQTASLWAFLLLAGFALSALDRPTPAALCGYWIAALLFVTAKPQEIVQVPAIALFGVLLTKAGPAPVSRGARPWALAAALFAAAIVYYLRIPPTISGPGLHNQVFVEILGQSPDPAADLRDLGLPAEWAAYRGVNPHAPGSPYATPRFRDELFRRAGPGRLLIFWARHPRRAAGLVRRCLQGALEMRPPELGNFRESDGLPPLARSRAFSIWSAVKRRGVRHSLLVIAAVIVATAAAGAALARRGRPDAVRRRGAALVALAAIAAAELLVPPFAQGAWGIERVLFGFQVVFDMCVISLVLLIAGALAFPRPSSGA